ncbi:hypothetical protein HanIR_Chr07g0340481 [Helianthus annuus]|nr:hypothetical protein HanIR_Chr07g0340481 [Helianthus annuus]
MLTKDPCVAISDTTKQTYSCLNMTSQCSETNARLIHVKLSLKTSIATTIQYNTYNNTTS